MIYEDGDLAGAVFIFSEDRELIREMNYSEYEALLDAYVPAFDLANRELNGVYCEINSKHQIEKAVFFIIHFTAEGFIDQGTSVPLFQLALHARKGPNLGAGPIGLACASQCPIKHLSLFLWDPDFSTKHEFKALVEAVKRNRMSIQFLDPDPEKVRAEEAEEKSRAAIEENVSQRLRKEFDKELRDRLANTIREQRLKASSILREREKSISELKQQYNARIDEYREMLDQSRDLLKDAKERNDSLKSVIDGQAEKIQGLREYFELKLEEAESGGGDQLEELKRTYELEMEVAIEAQTKEMREMLQMREVEILYRNEQESKLLEEVEHLRNENEALINNSGDHLLSKMLEAGLSFVTFQPGAGHLTVPMSDIPKFLEHPTAYVAENCGVSEKHYNEWLEHYHMPVCKEHMDDGEMCGEYINRVESPSDFIPGESDRCTQHRINKKPILKIAASGG